MVSAAKMRKAVQATLDSRHYATLAKELLARLAKSANNPSVWTKERQPKNVAVILVTSNRGLCGSFNTNLFRKTRAILQTEYADAQISIIGIGKKSATFAKRFGYNLSAVYDTLNERPQFTDILPIIEIMKQTYLDKTYDRVLLASTEYENSLLQKPAIRQILPIMSTNDERPTANDQTQTEFEPNQKVILDNILPRLVETQLHHAILEASASEQSARMVAMKKASDAAGDMIGALTLEFNKGRQAAITQEIAEIAGGAAALA